MGMGWLAWIVVGLIAGWLAGQVMKGGGYGVLMDIILGITAIAGGLMATYISFGPFVGFDYVIIMYSGVVLGGMGSILGAFWGGLTVGFVQQFSALILPPQLQNAAIFVVFLMIVLLRPQGLFGRSAERA